MKWIMIKVKEILTVLLIISIIGLVWCAFIGLYSAVVGTIISTILKMGI